VEKFNKSEYIIRVEMSIDDPSLFSWDLIGWALV